MRLDQDLNLLARGLGTLLCAFLGAMALAAFALGAPASPSMTLAAVTITLVVTLPPRGEKLRALGVALALAAFLSLLYPTVGSLEAWVTGSSKRPMLQSLDVTTLVLLIGFGGLAAVLLRIPAPPPGHGFIAGSHED